VRGIADRSFQSLAGKTKHQLWLELCDIITKHPAEVRSLPVDGILRGGIRKFTDEVGRLWTSLADYYIRRALFERARDIYEVWLIPLGRRHLPVSGDDEHLRRGEELPPRVAGGGGKSESCARWRVCSAGMQHSRQRHDADHVEGCWRHGGRRG
jgi:hypothetical protein